MLFTIALFFGPEMGAFILLLKLRASSSTGFFKYLPPGYFAILCPIKNITWISCDFYLLLQEIHVIFLIGRKMAKYLGGRYLKNPVDEEALRELI